MLVMGPALKEKAIGAIATGVVAVSFVLAVVAFFVLLHHSDREITIHLFNWISVGSPARTGRPAWSTRSRSRCACS